MSAPRASTILFNQIQFYDEDGVLATVDSATLTLKYMSNKRWTTATVTLSFSSPYWSGSWASSVADAPSTVYGHLEGLRDSDSLKIVKDFTIKLTANRANDAHHESS